MIVRSVEVEGLPGRKMPCIGVVSGTMLVLGTDTDGKPSIRTLLRYS